jgi:Outer membrane protein beta-barrel domain
MFKWTIVLLCFVSFHAFGQRQKPKNYSRFDERRAHFGFMLGVNQADFSLYQNIDAFEQFGIKSVVSKSQVGGQLGIVSTLKLGSSPTTRLRFLPSLSFQERLVTYTYISLKDPTKDSLVDQRVASTDLDFPLMFQFRTFRHNNFASYVLGGAQYSLDLQSQQNASQDLNNPFLKIKRDDFQAQAGIGFEFFATYFKFGIELKYSQGFVNSFIQDNTTISRPIDFLYNRVWLISFIFEG